MNNRFLNILNSIKNTISNQKPIINESIKIVGAYEYRCPKCGLVLEFNRNQSYVKCPNDNNTMFRM